MQWIQAVIIGFIAAFLVQFATSAAIALGVAPFNLMPAEAFLLTQGFNGGSASIILHYGYAIAAVITMVALSPHNLSLGKGVMLGGIMWLAMMLIVSPLIGWGFFGLGAVMHTTLNPLYVAASGWYPAFTFLQHMLFGVIAGGFASAWIDIRMPRQTTHLRYYS